MAESNDEPTVFSDIDDLSGIQKAAVLIITIGTKTAAGMLRTLKEREVEEITMEIANMKNIPSDVVDAVLKEYYQAMNAKKYILEGGYDYAHELLGALGGSLDADKVFRRLKENTEISVFDEFQESKVSQIANFIQKENPQVAALIFSQLRIDKVAEILVYLEPELQSEIVYRLASMDKISSEVVEEIEEVIKEQMGGMDALGNRVRSGTQTVAQILNEADISVEKHVLDEIDERDPQMAEDIREKMFLFEDILYFDDRAVQLIIGEIEHSDLVLGLKGVSTDLLNKFLENMSSRASTMLEEDMTALGPVPLKDVKEAQQRIIRRVKQLEEEGQIFTRKMDEEEIVE